MWTFLVVLVFLIVDCTVYVAGDCPRPTVGPNIELITDKEFPVPLGTTLTLSCEIGYRRVGGPASIVCSEEGWTPTSMKCQKRNCGSAGEVLNGYVDYSQGTDFGAYALVVCNEGFESVGTVKVFCGANGWMDRLAVCEAVVCDAPNSIANGYFSPMKDEYQHSEVISYGCNGEYKLNGSKTGICEHRQFKPAPPTCVLVNCPDPRVNNSVIAGGARPPYKHLSSVTLRCNVGYTMEGRDTVSCDINSKWSPKLPICNPVECKAPDITFGEVLDGARPSYKFSEKITVKCITGYKLAETAQDTLTCGERNQWLPAIPECTQIQCQIPQVAGGVLVGGPRPSYKYLDTVVFECEVGYNMTGTNTVTCGENEQWSPKLPQCKQIQCQTPQVVGGVLVGGPRPSYKYLDTVVFKCELGHNLSGTNTVTCDVNGQWSPELPQCTPVECKSLVVENAEVRASRIPSVYLDSVVVECNSGYTPTGQSTLKCDHNSQWSPEPPVCTRKNVKDDGNTSTTVGIVLGVLGGIAAVGGVLYFLFGRKKKGKLGRPVGPA